MSAGAPGPDGTAGRAPRAHELVGGFVLENGMLFDGTGTPGRVVDVVVRGERVVAVGSAVDAPPDAPRLDCRGMHVAPGFVDIHSHSDFTLLRDPRASSSVFQGVTLELVGNCGYGCFPIRDPGGVGESIYGFDESVPIEWRTARDYFATLEAKGPAVNVASLTPNAQLRRSVLPAVGERATPAQVASMVRALEETLDEGSFGLSTGLEYASEAMVSETEAVELLRPVGELDALYATHTRDRNGDGTAGIAEALRVAERAGVRAQISHLLPRGGGGRACLQLIEEATARGARVSFDQHTRLFGFTVLASVLPAWAFEQGVAGLERLLSDSDGRRRLSEYSGLLGDRWEQTQIMMHRPPRGTEGRSLAEIARERAQQPRDLVYDLLLSSLGDLHKLTVAILTYTREQQEEVFAHPRCFPASDATALAPDGPLADDVFPGTYGWAAWYWRHFAVERKLLPESEVIARMSSAPARAIGITDRGVVAAGAFADLAVFDPRSFRDRATLQQPNVLAEGMAHVFVNGTPTLLGGSLTGLRAGRVLRRAA